MSRTDRLGAIDDWLLDRLFQPITDYLTGLLGERLTAFDLGMSLQLGAVVLDLAADLADFAAGRMGAADGLYDGLSGACGVWFYVYLSRQRALVRPGKANPLRHLYRSLRLLALAFAAWGLLSGIMPGGTGALSAGLSALSGLAFVAGLYCIACQPRPPGWRRAARETVDMRHASPLPS